jgi:indole-3-glycerol phosphate synthase
MKQESTSILDKIIATKRDEIKDLKQNKSFKDFEKSIYFQTPCHSLKTSLRNSNFGIISEFKRKSPSAGFITDRNVLDQVSYYQNNGVSAISILTDSNYFGGTIEDILLVKQEVFVPILRKDFILDEIQIIESKAIGADVILLIAEILSKEEIISFTTLAQSLGMEVILELNHAFLFDKIYEEVDVIGVNNRDLAQQITKIQTSFDLYNFLPSNSIKISESGIKTVDELIRLKEIGYKGALIGESILKNENLLLEFNPKEYAN